MRSPFLITPPSNTDWVNLCKFLRRQGAALMRHFSSGWFVPKWRRRTPWLRSTMSNLGWRHSIWFRIWRARAPTSPTDTESCLSNGHQTNFSNPHWHAADFSRDRTVRDFTWNGDEANVPHRKEFQCAFAFRPSPDMVHGNDDSTGRRKMYGMPQYSQQKGNRWSLIAPGRSQQFPRN